ncbi:peptidase G2 autoproteolytic cleavage domain-containing protein [Paenibacillus tepidiphilus]|uniref:peptidase G2 autoproteolytic cleavage domain-containing protein n=1 Tax=Paenibacillus tepidiphilus TaxID=2608683 RepID=UPI00123A3B04|nr:peptidase G2 autoproteolytic cleavage domain-containing protein [Paenibacillus tepidiphilus]
MGSGIGNTASGFAAHAQGLNTTGSGDAAYSEGYSTLASGATSHAEGNASTASGNAAHAEGNLTQASADTAHAEGTSTVASGIAAHSEGYATQAMGESSHAEGSMTVAAGAEAHAEGSGTQAWGERSHTEGFNTSTQTTAANAHAEGEGNSVSGRAAHAEGGGVDPLGNMAPNFAGGDSSHAEGVGTTALGFASHAEGGTSDVTGSPGPLALGDFSHAEGQNTTASGISAHAEGVGTLASGAYAHAEGADTTADGQASHAEGFMTQALAANSHAAGENTTVLADHPGAYIMGQNGSTRFAYSWHLANGLGVGPTLNAAVIEGATGNLYLDGTVVSPAAADYAEMFETADGRPIEPGYFVTFDDAGEKIRKATSADGYILGVISARPAVLADASDLRWHKLFVTDEWGQIQMQEVEVPEIRDELGNVVREAFIKNEPVLNPEWNGSREYIPRREREEWVAVGIVGKLPVRDDGTCEPGGYCRPNDDGIAVPAPAGEGYRVMSRTGDRRIRIFVK